MHLLFDVNSTSTISPIISSLKIINISPGFYKMKNITQLSIWKCLHYLNNLLHSLMIKIAHGHYMSSIMSMFSTMFRNKICKYDSHYILSLWSWSIEHSIFPPIPYFATENIVKHSCSPFLLPLPYVCGLYLRGVSITSRTSRELQFNC